VDQGEIDRFSAVADGWWNHAGEFKALHKLNPVRIGYIRDHLLKHFGRDASSVRPFPGLSLVDVGCGGGLIAEPMARIGFKVTAIDAAEKSLAIAGSQRLAIDYRAATAEDLVAEGAQFDVVLALEIVEHVADTEIFFRSLGALVKPGGAVVVSTINRTAKSWALAKMGAEYVLRWVPVGTHDWAKFLRPSEVAAGLRASGLHIQDVSGIVYRPLSDDFVVSGDLDINYMMLAVKAD
jgi:2-polyprenyl-6-hydroxyphenyl methylase/3-demethylubiquinone-9 3-methyltransferase